MASVRVTKTINADPQRVFELITDFEHAAEHIKGIDKVEIMTDGPVGVGTRIRETRTFFGRQAVETMEITQFQPGKSYTTFAVSSGCEYVSGFTVTPAGDGCEVAMDFQATPKTLMAKVFSIMSGPMIKMVVKCVEDDLNDIKRIAEGEAQPAQA